MTIKELYLNKHICDMVYQVRNASYRMGDNGNGYYLMRLGDKTGQIDAIWQNTPDINLKVGDFICVEGKVQNYQGRLQLKIFSSFRVSPDSVDFDEFTLSAVNKKDLQLQLQSLIETVNTKPLYLILKRLLLEDYYDEFCNAPAATFNHHAYMGGLLEHSVSVAKICESYIPLYQQVNKDLLISGALIHDIGKIYEFEFNESILYSTKGNLLGHIYMGAQKFQEEIKKEKDFPEYLNNQITHIILSHHGIMERGAPVLPATLEAILVHKADTTDADAKAFLVSQGEGAGDNWLLSRTLNRMIYVEPAPKFDMRE